MVSHLRSSAFFLVAILVGLSLFYLMQIMIKADSLYERPDRMRTYLNFVRVKQTEELRTKERQPPQEPPPPEKPPETPDLSDQITRFNPSLNMDMPAIGMAVNSGDGPYLGALQKGDGLSGFDTDVIPIVQVPPAYPRGPKQAGIEGYVTMAVTIRPDGTVFNVKILESQPKRLFDKAATDAMKRWKFRPKVVDGNPVEQRARQTIEFKLGKT